VTLPGLELSPFGGPVAIPTALPWSKTRRDKNIIMGPSGPEIRITVLEKVSKKLL
jgi:hypothetical protein